MFLFGTVGTYSETVGSCVGTVGTGFGPGWYFVCVCFVKEQQGLLLRAFRAKHHSNPCAVLPQRMNLSLKANTLDGQQMKDPAKDSNSAERCHQSWTSKLPLSRQPRWLAK